MTMENIPWAIGGGIVSPSIARMLAYQATSGAEGVAGIGDFTVRQLAVAGGSVRISAGGAIMVSRYPGARNESYMCRAGDETVVAIAANAGTTTRYDLVIARVDDWNMPGGQPTPTTLPTNTVPAAKFQVISNVASNVKTAAQLNLNYPAIALARIAVPAATSAITTAMITSLREVAVPRRRRALLTRALYGADSDLLDATASTGEAWPNFLWTVEVPDWASRVRVVGQWNGVTIKTGSAYGGLWVHLGIGRADLIKTQYVGWDTTSMTNWHRETWGASDDVAVPASMRGQSIQAGLWASITGGTGGNRNPLLDGGSSVTLDLEFLEAPAEDA